MRKATIILFLFLLLTPLATASTTVQLETPDLYNLDDAYGDKEPGWQAANGGATTNLRVSGNATGDPGGYHSMIKFNISLLPAGSVINNAILVLTVKNNLLDAGEAFNVSVYHTYNFPGYNHSGGEWDETTFNGTNQPKTSIEMNQTIQDTEEISNGVPAVDALNIFNVTHAVRKEFSEGDNNVSFYFNTTYQTTFSDSLQWYAKENATVAHGLLRPYLNITYTGTKLNYSGNVTNTPSAYDGSSSNFNISWSTNQGSIGTVSLESNYSGAATNYTMVSLGGALYQYNITLPATTFYWKVYANTSLGASNATGQILHTITKANNQCHLNLTIGGSTYTDTDRTVESTDSVQALGYCDVGTATLYYDSTLQSNPWTSTHGAGVHTFVVNTTGSNENYTDNTTGQQVTLTVNAPSGSAGGGTTLVVVGNASSYAVTPINNSVTAVIGARTTKEFRLANNGEGLAHYNISIDEHETSEELLGLVSFNDEPAIINLPLGGTESLGGRIKYVRYHIDIPDYFEEQDLEACFLVDNGVFEEDYCVEVLVRESVFGSLAGLFETLKGWANIVLFEIGEGTCLDAFSTVDDCEATDAEFVVRLWHAVTAGLVLLLLWWWYSSRSKRSNR